MYLPQIKAQGYQNVINLGIGFTTKEFPFYSEISSFKAATGETHKLNGVLQALHGWITVDQLQAEGHTAKMGLGKADTKENKENGVYYTMSLNEEGEGKTVKGTITYTIIGIQVKGKMYGIKEGALKSDGTALQTVYPETYSGKSAKNSTLFKFFRKMIKEGLIHFDAKLPHLQLLEAAPKKEIAQKGKRETKPKAATKAAN